jgi:hypothetical protein
MISIMSFGIVVCMKKVTFATTVWEKDWKHVLLRPDYLRVKQIGNHVFPFAEKLLVINNVKDLAAVKRVASELVEQGVLTRFVVVDELAEKMLPAFGLNRSDFRVGPDAHLYEAVNPDWIYYNALGPLSAIYACESDYLLYLTGDVRLDKPVDWVAPALEKMEGNPLYQVANPVWNDQYDEAKRESSHKEGKFFVAPHGFSDQIFLVKKSPFMQPIYSEIRPDSAHFPRGDVFEKRVYSAMRNRGWQRLIYRKGSYTHENF